MATVAVQVEVGHVVSYGAMVSRAYLKDRCAGVVVDHEDRGPWLVSVRSVLLPDPGQLKQRAEREKGIPSEQGSSRLMKIAITWGEGSTAEVKTPQVAAGELGAAAIPLTFPASLPGKIYSSEGPRIVELGDDPPVNLGDTVAVAVMTPDGALLRWGHIASDPGFGGVPGMVALGVALNPAEAGSPVYLFPGGEPVLCGLADPVDVNTARLLSPSALADALTGSGE